MKFLIQSKPKSPRESFSEQRQVIASQLMLSRSIKSAPHKDFFAQIKPEHWQLAHKLLHDKPNGSKLGRINKGLSLPGEHYRNVDTSQLTKEEKEMLSEMRFSFVIDNVRGQKQVFALEHREMDVIAKHINPKEYLGQGSFKLAKYAVNQQGEIEVYQVTRKITTNSEEQAKSTTPTQDKSRNIVPFKGTNGSHFFACQINHISDKDLLQIFIDLAEQLSLERYGHGDFKEENFVVMRTPSRAYHAEIIDRDIHADISKKGYFSATTRGYKIRTKIGEISEFSAINSILKDETLNSREKMTATKYRLKKLDVYAFGVCMARIMSSHALFSCSQAEIHAFKKSMRGDDFLAHEPLETLEEILQRNPSMSNSDFFEQIFTLIKRMLQPPQQRHIIMQDVAYNLHIIALKNNLRISSRQQEAYHQLPLIIKALQREGLSLLTMNKNGHQKTLEFYGIPSVYTEHITLATILVTHIMHDCNNAEPPQNPFLLSEEDIHHRIDDYSSKYPIIMDNSALIKSQVNHTEYVKLLCLLSQRDAILEMLNEDSLQDFHSYGKWILETLCKQENEAPPTKKPRY